ncbi:MAG TPA: glycosyltransferase [Solirubrobacteraceae bacterium]|nr:glycosyltransferase [Solirubrobacteraceae bacterium]
MKSACAVIPVKDGERYLDELLAALAGEGFDEILVIDSGSRDRSTDLARAAGARVIEIGPHEFGHGRTRNLGAEQTTAELICFLTQDATPCAGWLAAYREAFTLDPRVGAAYGPHLPRPDTSPMIARELTEFFSGFAPDGRPRVQRAGDPTFLANVNAAYDRGCWSELRFRDVAYAEDQAFGADLLAAGWTKVYHPAAAVLHAHDYGPTEFMRRYFDEYRGLRETTGHIESFDAVAALAAVRDGVRGDRRWLAEHGVTGLERARWLGRSGVHHAGRRVFAALGSRASALPAPLERRVSLEGRASVGSPRSGSGPVASPTTAPQPTPVAPRSRENDYALIEEVWRSGTVQLLDPVPGTADRERLRIAMILPPFSRGSGGHNTLMQILTRLEQRGHICSVWVHDFLGVHRDVWPAVLRSELREFFAPFEGPVYKGFDRWQGADVLIATGWQTVHPALRLDQCRARVYVVNDHEPEFYATSTERALASDTYRHGLHCIAASPWLRDILVEYYAASADAFQLGVAHDIYVPRPVRRRRDTVVYYARHSTARRAVPIGLMALAELHRRRPNVRIVLFGTQTTLDTSFPYHRLGVLTPEQLSWLYSESTVGLCLSLTNFSLMPKEMLACGLPCVELSGVSAESIFGPDGPLELAPLNPALIADALERLLDDRELWERRSTDGIAFVASHTWDHAADEVEAGMRHALALREAAAL